MTAWDLSCRDWQQRIREGRSLVPDLPLISDRATKAARIFGKLRIPDVPGTPTFAEAGGDWFLDIVRALHGSFDPVERERFIREMFVLVPKKNAKTTYGAGLMLTSLLMNDRPRAEFLLVAPTQKIAELAFNQIAGMIDLEPVFQRPQPLFHVQSHLKKVTFKKLGATLEIRSFDPKVMTGVKPSGVLIDELHEIARSPDADRVIGQIRGGIVSQKEGFFFFTTTQSERPPRGVFKAELEKARAIRDGEATGKMLPVLYELPPDVATVKKLPGEPYRWEDSAFWHMVTPNNGRSITVDRLVEDYETAKLAGEGELRRWASQHLNIEVGAGLANDAWGGAEFWPGRGDRTLTLDDLLVRSEVVTVGVDGGGLDDLFGLCVIGRERGTRRWLVWNHAYAHPIVLERRKDIVSALNDFVAEGSLTICEVSEYVAAIATVVVRIRDAGLLPEKDAVGFDPNNIAAFVDALAEQRIDGPMLRRLLQGPALSPAIWGLEHKLSNDSISHGGTALMNWCVGNVLIDVRNNGNVATKQAAGRAKIDPYVAMLCAAMLMSWNPKARPQFADVLASFIVPGMAA